MAQSPASDHTCQAGGRHGRACECGRVTPPRSSPSSWVDGKREQGRHHAARTARRIQVLGPAAPKDVIAEAGLARPMWRAVAAPIVPDFVGRCEFPAMTTARRVVARPGRGAAPLSCRRAIGGLPSLCRSRPASPAISVCAPATGTPPVRASAHDRREEPELPARPECRRSSWLSA